MNKPLGRSLARQALLRLYNAQAFYILSEYRVQAHRFSIVSCKYENAKCVVITLDVGSSAGC